MDEPRRLTALQFQQADGVEDWRVLAFGARAWFAAPSHSAGAALVRRAVEIGDAAGRAPDIDLRATGVQLRIWSAASPGLTEDDVSLARAISAAARDLGLVADPSLLQSVQLTIDTTRPDAVLPFWQAALAYDAVREASLVDPTGRDPLIWFQEMDVERPLRQRLHVDIAVAHELAPGRVAATEAAWGRVVRGSDFHAAVADADGNEVDIVPLQPEGDLADVPERADWRLLFSAMVHYPTGSATAANLAASAAEIADEVGVELLIDLRPAGVTIASGKDRWDHPAFPDLATRVQAAARALELQADAAPLRFVQVGIDAVDVEAVRTFWCAALGYELDAREFVTDIVDARQLMLPFFFQPMSADDTERRAQRNRMHVDLFVPEDQAEVRIAAAIAAGGRLVYDAEAPDWWTLADPEGNEIDIAVAVGRQERLATREHA